MIYVNFLFPNLTEIEQALCKAIESVVWRDGNLGGGWTKLAMERGFRKKKRDRVKYKWGID